MKHHRVAVFIDYHNTISEFNREIARHYKIVQGHKDAPLYKLVTSKAGAQKSIDYLKSIVWNNFNNVVLKNLTSKYLNIQLEHVGTYITLGIRKVNSTKNKDKKLVDKIKEVALLDGFIVHFELMKEYASGKSKEYGVDARIACQMLLGAFRDQYDIAVLVSNDQDFIPAIDLVQNSYGKKVYHLGPGFQLKTSSYGSLDYDQFFKTILEINYD